MANQTDRKSVEEYIEKLAPKQKRLVNKLIRLVQDAEPKATLSIKWAQPVFELNGPFCYIKAFSNHINFGFWRGAQLSKGKGVSLESSGTNMGHIKVSEETDIVAVQFQAWVKEAVKLNKTKGDPTKNK